MKARQCIFACIVLILSSIICFGQAKKEIIAKRSLHSKTFALGNQTC